MDDLLPIDGRALRTARLRAKLTQSDVAERVDLDVDQSYVSKVERGTIKRVQPATAEALAAIVGVPVTEIVRHVAPPAAVHDTEEFARRVAEQVRQMLLGDQQVSVASAGPGSPADASVARPLVARLQGQAVRGPLTPMAVVGDCLHPRLQRGWVAWVNPDAPRRPGDVVCALVGDDQVVFKILSRDRDTGQEFLTALDNRPAIPVGPNAVIQGVVQLVQHPP